MIILPFLIAPLFALCRAKHTQNSGEKQEIDYYDSDEHQYIGNQVKFPNELGINKDLTLPNGIKITFGDIIAMAGDFYGRPKEPIVNTAVKKKSRTKEQQRFLAAYESLAIRSRGKVKNELKKLLKMMKEDKVARNKSEGDCKDCNSNKDYDEAVGGFWIGSLPVFPGRMIKLALKNYDHFQPQAARAYLAGHQLALREARKAAKEDNDEKKKAKLMKAYTLDAFACHYLTDCFSAGHIRTPRVKLSDNVALHAGDLLSKFMHDEDCKFGLRVKNVKGDKWIAYGDKYLLKNENGDNLKIILQAVEQSIHQVRHAFKHPQKKIDLDEITDFIPFVDDQAKNNTPLFQVIRGKLHYRSDYKDLQSKKTTSDWTGIGVASNLRNYNAKNSALPLI